MNTQYAVNQKVTVNCENAKRCTASLFSLSLSFLTGKPKTRLNRYILYTIIPESEGIYVEAPSDRLLRQATGGEKRMSKTWLGDFQKILDRTADLEEACENQLKKIHELVKRLAYDRNIRQLRYVLSALECDNITFEGYWRVHEFICK